MVIRKTMAVSRWICYGWAPWLLPTMPRIPPGCVVVLCPGRDRLRRGSASCFRPACVCRAARRTKQQKQQLEQLQQAAVRSPRRLTSGVSPPQRAVGASHVIIGVHPWTRW